MRTYVTASGSTYAFSNGRLTRRAANKFAGNEFTPPITNATATFLAPVEVGKCLHLRVTGCGVLRSTPVVEVIDA